MNSRSGVTNGRNGSSGRRVRQRRRRCGSRNGNVAYLGVVLLVVVVVTISTKVVVVVVV